MRTHDRRLFAAQVAPDTGIDGWHWTAALERPVVCTTDTSPSNPTECWTGYIEGGNSRVERYYYMHNAALLGGPTVSFEAHPGGLSPDLNGQRAAMLVPHSSLTIGASSFIASSTSTTAGRRS